MPCSTPSRRIGRQGRHDRNLWVDRPPRSRPGREHSRGQRCRTRSAATRQSATPALVERGCAVAARSGIVPAEIHRFGSLAAAVQGRIALEVARRPDARVGARSGRRRDRDSIGSMASSYCQRIGGSFAIALLDLDNSSGLLAIDRMGTRTLCYANPTGRLVFGSTTESVAAHPAVGCRLSNQAIFDYLYCHVVPSPRTIFDGVWKLQPGECVVFRNGRAERRFYWQLRYADGAHPDQAALKDRFRGLLRDATRACDRTAIPTSARSSAGAPTARRSRVC